MSKQGNLTLFEAVHPEFSQELESLINRYSIDTYLAIPDYQIKKYLTDHLETLKELVSDRDHWFAFKPSKFDSVSNREKTDESSN